MLKLQYPNPVKAQTGTKLFITTDEKCSVIETSTYLHTITAGACVGSNGRPVTELFFENSLVFSCPSLIHASASGLPFYATGPIRLTSGKKLFTLWVVMPVLNNKTGIVHKFEWWGCETKEAIMDEASGLNATEDFFTTLINASNKLSQNVYRLPAFKAMADDYPVIIVTCDENNKLLYANRRWIECTGKSLKEAGSCYWQHYVNYTGFGNDSHEVQEHALHYYPSSVICRLKNTSGTYWWALDTSLPILNNNGTLAGHVHCLARVHDQQVTIEKIKYQSGLIENISDSIVSTDLNRNILTWNKAAEKMYGYAASEVTGKIISEFITYQYLDTTEEEAYRHLLENGIWKGEVTFNRKDGVMLYLFASVSWITDERGELSGIVAVIRNITAQKEAERALHESEKRFRFLSENTRDLICLHAPDGSFIYVSPAASTMLGYDPQELTGRKFENLCHPEDRKMLEQELAAANEKKNTTCQYRLVRKDGQCLWMDTIMQPITDKTGNIINFQSSTRDITGRKLEEIAIRTKELQFRTLAENAPSIIQRLDSTLRYTYCNITFEKIFNQSGSTIIGKTPGEVYLSGKYLAIFTSAANAVFADGKSKSVTIEVTRKDGRYYCFCTTIAPEFNENNEVTTLMVISNDITEIRKKDVELKEKEAELRISNERFSLAAKATTDAIWEINLQTGEVFVSEEFICKFGYTAAEIKSQWEDWFIDKLWPDDKHAVLAKIYRSLKQHEPFWKDEFRWRTKDGSYKYISNQASIFYDKAGRPYRAIGAIQNISERKSTEAELLLKDKLVSAVAEASKELMVEPVLHRSIDKCLAIIGRSANVDRIIVVQYLYDSNKDEHYLSHTYEWGESGYEQMITNPDLSYIPEKQVSDVIDYLKTGGTINTQVKDISNDFLKDCLNFYQVKSLLVIPVFTNAALWGFIGWEQCSYDRIWTGTEIDTLKTFTSSTAAVVELKETEDKLKASEEKFKALFQHSPDIVFVVDKQLIVKYVTPSIEKVLGCSDADAINKSGLEYLHPDDIKKLEQEFTSIVSEPEYRAMVELRVRGSKGEWIWMEAKAQNKLLDPNINGIILSLRNITERKHDQQALTERSETITGILSSITDGFVALDKAFNVKLWNKVAERITMVSSEEITGINICEKFPELINSIIHKEFNKALSDNVTGYFEEYIKSVNRWFDATVYPGENGLFIYFKDITARKKQELMLEIEKNVLQVNADQLSTLKNTLDFFLVSIERLNPGVVSAVILLEENSKKTRFYTAPGLPPSYVKAINNLTLEPYEDSYPCIEAMLTKRTVIVPGTTTNRFWVKHNDILSEYAVTAIWSVPIINAEEQVIGCFEWYFTKNKVPVEDASLLGRITDLLRLIIENKRADDKIRIINDRYAIAFRTTNEAIWDWDVDSNMLFGGEEFYNLLGYKKGYKMSAVNFWEKHIHPDHREKISSSIQAFISSRSTALWMEEYRLKRSDGNYAVVINKGYLAADASKGTIRMIGSIADITKKRHLDKKYIKNEVDKQKLVAMAVVNAQESERAKIGKELHDNVNQILSTAKLFLEVAKTNAKERITLIGKSTEQIRNAINELRYISQSLVPPSIGDLGLTESIRDLADSIAFTKKLKVEYHNIGDIESCISDDQKLMLFRIVQEQVNNVIKHAQAKHLLIQLVVNAVEIELTITDDGIGFDHSLVISKKGMGLANMTSRVQLYNGKLKLISFPGKGCKLIVKVVRIPK